MALTQNRKTSYRVAKYVHRVWHNRDTVAACEHGMMYHKRPDGYNWSTAPSHSRGKHSLDHAQENWNCCRKASCCATDAQHGASSQKQSKRLPSKRTRGSDAGECRGAAATCLHQHSWRGCTCAAELHSCPSAGTAVHPAPTRHIWCYCSAARGSFATGQSQ